MIDPVAALDRDLEDAEVRIRRADVPPVLLGRPNPRRILAVAFIDWAVIAACWVAMWKGPGWLYPLWAVLIGGRFYALAVLQHDLSHMPIPRGSLLMHVLDVLCGYPLAITREAMRANHVRHHRDAGLPSDPYFREWAHGRPLGYVAFFFLLVLLGPFWLARSLLGAAACAVPWLRPLYTKTYLLAPGERSTREEEITRCARSELGLCAVHLGLIALAVFQPELVLYFYVVPMLVGYAFQAYRFLADHLVARAPDRSPESIIATTRDTGFGLLGLLFFAPHNIGYHVVHHLHPQVAYENLPRLRDWYRARYPGLYPGGERSPSVYPPLRPAEPSTTVS